MDGAGLPRLWLEFLSGWPDADLDYARARLPLCATYAVDHLSEPTPNALLRPHLYEAYRDGERRSRGVPSLTERRWQILRLIATPYSNAQIARRLFISARTMRKHLENIFDVSTSPTA